MKNLISAISLVACCITLSNCGGGGGDRIDTSPPTIRPKTLDGVVLILDTSVRLEFIRSTGTPGAIANGDVETGAFIYTLGGLQLRTYRNSTGGNSDVRYPDEVSTAAYSYRPINNSSGVLTLTAVGSSDLITTGIFGADNGSFVYLFESDSNGIENHVVVMDVTFTENGSFITSNAATVSIPGGNPQFDTVLIPTTVSLAAGGLVPTNYNPLLDPNRKSKISPESLNNKRFQFTNGIPNPSLNFTIQFASEALGPIVTNIDEIGLGLLRVNGAAVDRAVNYTYTRTGGTDDAILVLSSSNTTFDGRYTLRFAGRENGMYIGNVDAGTPNAADVSGSFFLISPR